MDNPTLRAYFTSLGLQPEVADIYLALARRSPQTISELSRSSGIERTRIYRLLDTLQRTQLIEVDEEYSRGLLRAAPLTNLELLLTDREQQLGDLRERLPNVVSALQQTIAQQHRTSVQFYRGRDGLRQMLWNQTHSQGESLSILQDTIQLRTDARFYERWTEHMNEHPRGFRSIIGDEFVRQLHEWHGPVIRARLQNWQAHFVVPEVFAITTNQIVYDDIVAYYSWNGQETFGVELHNPDIAASQRQLFELLWNAASPWPTQE